MLYVVYRAPKESRDRSVIPDRLKALGLKRLHSAFWEIKEDGVHNILKLLEKNQPILLRRTRDVRKPQFMKDNRVSELGSLIIVMYRVPKEEKRERIKNLLRKAPCIRLRRSVYAFFQRHSLFDRNNKLIDAQEFADFIREIKGDVRVIPRTVIVNTNSIERLLQEIRERIEHESSNIVKGCKELYGKALIGDDVRTIRNSLSNYKRRFLNLKRISGFYKDWLRMDFSQSLMKSYRALKKANSVVEMD